jgi:hypothetical protein
MNPILRNCFPLALVATFTVAVGADARSVPPFSGLPFNAGTNATTLLTCVTGGTGGGELFYNATGSCPSSMEWIWPLTVESGGPFTVEAEAGSLSGTVKCEAFSNNTSGTVSSNSALTTLSTTSLTTITTTLTLVAGGDLSLVCTFDGSGSVSAIDWTSTNSSSCHTDCD